MGLPMGLMTPNNIGFIGFIGLIGLIG